MTKPKLIIPARIFKSPQQELVDLEIRNIHDLYIRWVTNTLLPQDDFVLIQNMTELLEMKQRSEEQALWRMRHLDWKVEQMNLNPPPEEGNE